MGRCQGPSQQAQAQGELRGSGIGIPQLLDSAAGRATRLWRNTILAIGRDSNGLVLNVVYTLREERIRINSVWKASRHERKAYEKAVADRPL